MNMKLLKEIIDSKGMKYQFIAGKLGISRESLYNKLNGKTEFTAGEIRGIADALSLNFSTIQEIFFD